MAITRAQQAKQLLALGGRIGLQGGGADLGAGASGMGSGNTGGGGNKGGNGGDPRSEYMGSTGKKGPPGGLSDESRDDLEKMTKGLRSSITSPNRVAALNDAINKANAMKAAQKKQVPQEVRDASKRQYTAGGPKDKGENKYTTQDKKTIIDYNKDK